MIRIPFTRSPGYVTIGEALSLAARYWRATTDRWILAVAAIALATGLAEWLLGGSVVDQQTMTRTLLPGAGSQIDAAELPRLLAGPLAVALVSLVAGWFLVANAVAGLRGREVTLGWVVGSGLRALVASMIVALVFVGLLALALALGALGLLLMLVLVPGFLYVAVRLQFWTVAIFDGSGIDEGSRTSWRLTRNAVGRAIGWGLAAFGIGLLVTAVDIAIDYVLAGAPVVGAVVTSTLDASLQAYTILLVAILYESQRQRNLPPPVMAAPSSYDPTVADGPPPPPAPPADPWRG